VRLDCEIVAVAVGRLDGCACFDGDGAVLLVGCCTLLACACSAPRSGTTLRFHNLQTHIDIHVYSICQSAGLDVSLRCGFTLAGREVSWCPTCCTHALQNLWMARKSRTVV
jgi:hypothetical protein